MFLGLGAYLITDELGPETNDYAQIKEKVNKKPIRFWLIKVSTI
jgi:hypothetical protein